MTLLELSQVHEVCMWLEATSDRDLAFREQHRAMAAQLRRVLLAQYWEMMGGASTKGSTRLESERSPTD